MLSYEEELELSDLLVARRQVNDLLKEEGRRPSREERRIIREGDRAATELVEHYTPLVWSIASGIVRKLGLSSRGAVTYDDLVGEGIIAAMKCCNSFNARGKGGRPGRRFSTYSSMAISKAMNRYIARNDTPYRMDISVIQDTMIWNAAKRDLESKLRRVPTDEEVAEQANVDRSRVKDDILRYDSMMDIDDREAYNDPGSNNVVDLVSEEDAANALLLQVLDNYIVEEFLEAYSAYLGLDIGYPRDINETAREIGSTRPWTRSKVDTVTDILRHPHYRVAIAGKLEDMGWQPTSEE